MVASRGCGRSGNCPSPPRCSSSVLALFFGGGPGYGSLPWLGGGALLAIVVAARASGASPRAGIALAAARCARRLARRSRSRGRCCRTARGTTRTATLVYLLFAPLGLWLAGADARARARADGAPRGAARLVAPRQGAAVRLRLRPARSRAPARAGRPLEPARARSPTSRSPLALWRAAASRARCSRTSAIVALLLTYSRGGLAHRCRRAVAWFALDRRARSRAPARCSPRRCRQRPSSGSRSRCPA